MNEFVRFVPFEDAERIITNRLREIAVKHGCEVLYIDMKTRTFSLSCPPRAAYDCAAEIQLAMEEMGGKEGLDG